MVELAFLNYKVRELLHHQDSQIIQIFITVVILHTLWDQIMQIFICQIIQIL